MIDKQKEYEDMYRCYLANEDRYLEWSTERKRFMEAQRERSYYKKNNAKNRSKYAEKVINDFPRLALSTRDLKCQIGGCTDIIKALKKTKFDDEPFFWDDWVAYRMYDRLKKYPDEIYDAVENTYEWSCKIDVRTTLIAEKFLKVINFICNECLFNFWEKENSNG